MPWRARDVRPLLLRRRAGRPQLKRDPLGRLALLGMLSMPARFWIFSACCTILCSGQLRPSGVTLRFAPTQQGKDTCPAVGDTVPPGAASDSDGTSSLSQTVARPIRYISVLIDGRRAVWNWPVDDVHGRAGLPLTHSSTPPMSSASRCSNLLTHTAFTGRAAASA